MPRLNFDVSDELNDSLKQLQKKVGLSTMKDLINNALTFYELAVEEIENGSEIASVKDDSYRKITMPSLQHVAKNAAKKTQKRPPEPIETTAELEEAAVAR